MKCLPQPTLFFVMALPSNAVLQVEVDDYRDYEKALGALSESLKYATMSQTPQGARSGYHTQLFLPVV
jgi:hypothetical protein